MCSIPACLNDWLSSRWARAAGFSLDEIKLMFVPDGDLVSTGGCSQARQRSWKGPSANGPRCVTGCDMRLLAVRRTTWNVPPFVASNGLLHLERLELE